nr:phage tail protein [uncultured Cohaesibacter sp.]
MALLTFDPPVGPSPGTNHKPQVNLRENEFGDGYTQTSPKGINHIKRNVELSWDALTYAQMLQIDDFLQARGGYEPFYFKPYGERFTLKWTCKEWTKQASDGVWTVSATLVQSFTNDL